MSLEDRLLWLVKAGVALSGVALGAGLALHVAGRTGNAATLLATGLILLMAMPATRVVIAVLERVRIRDWRFVLVTLAVLIELSISMWLAAQKV